MSLKHFVVAAVVLVGALGASVCACGLFPSLGDLESTDAGQTDAAPTDAKPTDAAQTETGIDAATDALLGDAATDAPTSGSITFRASTTNSGVGTNVTVAKPAGTVTNDFMWALLTLDDDVISVSSIPQSWTIATQQADGSFGFRTVAYQIVVGASAPASYAITLSGSIDWSITLVTYAGVRIANPFDVAPVFTTKQSNPPYTAPSISTTVPNAVVVFGFTGETGNAGWSNSAPLIERATTDFLLSLDMTLAAPGPSNPQVVGYSGGGGMVVVGALAPQ